MFHRLSETLLVRLTPIWVFPLVIGIYGLIAEKIFWLLDNGQAATLWEATQVWGAAAAVLGLVVLIPFLVVTVRNSLVVALAAAVFWAGLLVGVFEGVFPKL